MLPIITLIVEVLGLSALVLGLMRIIKKQEEEIESKLFWDESGILGIGRNKETMQEEDIKMLFEIAQKYSDKIHAIANYLKVEFKEKEVKKSYKQKELVAVKKKGGK